MLKESDISTKMYMHTSMILVGGGGGGCIGCIVWGVCMVCVCVCVCVYDVCTCVCMCVCV